MNIDALNEKKEFKSSVKLSLIVHGVIFAFFIVKGFVFKGEAIDYSAAVRVDIVALPEKLDPSKVQLAKPEPAAPPKKEEKKAEPKVETPKKEAKPEPDAINLSKTKSKQQEALDKLKKQSAFDKIKSDLEKERAQKEALQKVTQVKGNVISPGTALTGLDKIQHESYVADLDRHIKNNWSLPEWLAKKDLKAQARIRLDENGNIVSREIVRSSGNESYDEAVMNAIVKSAPYPKPPEKLSAVIRVQGILLGFPE